VDSNNTQPTEEYLYTDADAQYDAANNRLISDLTARSNVIIRAPQWSAPGEGGQLIIGSYGSGDINGETAATGNVDMYTTQNSYFGMVANKKCLRLFHGDGGATALLDEDGNWRVSRDIVAFSSSDATLKNNLKPIEHATDKVTKLTGYEFDWDTEKQQTYQGHDVGVVAQEVEQVLPEVVNTREDGTKAVRYDKLVPLLIESIKQLNERVKQLESEQNN
jgi:hypothetical protein